MYKIATYLAYLSFLSLSLAFLPTTKSRCPDPIKARFLQPLIKHVFIGNQARSNKRENFINILKGEKPKDNVAVMDKKPFDLGVNWPLGDETWKELSEDETARSGITRYRLYHRRFSITLPVGLFQSRSLWVSVLRSGRRLYWTEYGSEWRIECWVQFWESDHYFN